MALMFPRVAHNFIKAGYFPTDEDTLQRALNCIAPKHPDSEGIIRIIDTCAGEGIALAECKHHLGENRTSAFGIEYDKERAWHAKSVLDLAIHGDMQNCIIGQRSFGLLWLNPPYGDLVRDGEMIGDADESKNRARLEKLFFQRSISCVQFGGVVVLIIPYTCMDKHFSKMITSHLCDIRVFLAPEQQFKQIVIFGVKRRTDEISRINSQSNQGFKEIQAILDGCSNGELPPILPEQPDFEPYLVPAAPTNELVFRYGGMDIEQLEEEISRLGSPMWDQFEIHFGRPSLPKRSPLRKPSNWHLALTLAAGLIEGLVSSKDGRIMLVKGDTHKDKSLKVSYEPQEDGTSREVRTYTDKFVPVIRGIDMTPNSNTYGEMFVVK